MPIELDTSYDFALLKALQQEYLYIYEYNRDRQMNNPCSVNGSGKHSPEGNPESSHIGNAIAVDVSRLLDQSKADPAAEDDFGSIYCKVNDQHTYLSARAPRYDELQLPPHKQHIDPALLSKDTNPAQIATVAHSPKPPPPLVNSITFVPSTLGSIEGTVPSSINTVKSPSQRAAGVTPLGNNQPRPRIPTPAQCNPANRYPCSHCPRRFTRPSLLKKHLLIHTRPEHCPTCDWTFPNIHDRNRHVKWLHGGEGIRCEICGAVSRDKGNLSKHMKSMHDKEYHKTRYFPDAAGKERGDPKPRLPRDQKCAGAVEEVGVSGYYRVA
ncbi:hypothetical protein EDC01DRAFT_105474 [Geopyxis carbonaria]|nr:hypothetical protein EDC01DRAFT_105474 [Geopyxis carbonaria]